MGQPYIGEIRLFAGNFAPVNWAFCDGRLLPISDYETLYELIGTTYGGDGQSTFGLPDLRGRAPLHQGTAASGTTYNMADAGGAESVTLTLGQLPTHTHTLVAATGSGTTADPTSNVLGTSPSSAVYVDGTTPTNQLAATSLTPRGGSQAHDNLMPYLTINPIISLFGVFPTQT
ncbi:MAG TPA: tail fiber protein [Baekduia sp.]